MQKIKAWLTKGDYDAGVILYAEFGSNNFLKKQFAKGKSPYNEKQLRSELIKLSNQPVTTNELIKTWKRENSRVDFECEVFNTGNSDPKPVDQSDLQKKYLQLLKKRDHLYQELNARMEEKHHLPEGKQLHECCKRILILHNQVSEVYIQLDYYQVHQQFPDVPAEPEKPPIELETEIQLIRASISKAKSRLKKPDCKTRKSTEKLLATHEQRLAVLLAKREQK